MRPNLVAALPTSRRRVAVSAFILALLALCQVSAWGQTTDADSSSGTLKAPTAGFASSVIGQELDVSGEYVFHDHLVANVGVGHLSPGALLLQNKHCSAETLGYFGLTYRLRVDKVKADR